MPTRRFTGGGAVSLTANYAWTGTHTWSSAISVAADTDVTSYLGRCALGQASGAGTDLAIFAHYDRMNSTDYALMAQTSGTVAINATSGRSLFFQNNGSDIFYINGATNNLAFTADNTRDLGAIGALRPANLFLGTAAYTPIVYLTSGTDSTTRGALKVTKVTKAHDSNLFDAVGLTDSIAVFTQPANSILIAAYIMLDTQFAATGMTDLDVTIGDAGNNTGILNATGNMTSDAANTKYTTKGAYFDATAGSLLKESATAWTAYATAVGANLSTTSAGQISLFFVTLEW